LEFQESITPLMDKCGSEGCQYVVEGVYLAICSIIFDQGIPFLQGLMVSL
jgi:hypothetical protein